MSLGDTPLLHEPWNRVSRNCPGKRPDPVSSTVIRTGKIRIHREDGRAMLDSEPFLLPVLANDEVFDPIRKALSKIEVCGPIALFRPRVELSLLDGDQVANVRVRTVNVNSGLETGFRKQEMIPPVLLNSCEHEVVFEARVHDWFFGFMLRLLRHELAESLRAEGRFIVNPHP